MKAFIPALFTALFMASCTPPTAIAQQVTSQESNKAPYDIALDHCSDKGGLARYTVSGDTVKFSCADDIANVITINT